MKEKNCRAIAKSKAFAKIYSLGNCSMLTRTITKFLPIESVRKSHNSWEGETNSSSDRNFFYVRNSSYIRKEKLFAGPFSTTSRATLARKSVFPLQRFYL